MTHGWQNTETAKLPSSSQLRSTCSWTDLGLARMRFASFALEKASSDEPLASHAGLLTSNQTHHILPLAVDLSKRQGSLSRTNWPSLRLAWQIWELTVNIDKKQGPTRHTWRCTVSTWQTTVPGFWCRVGRNGMFAGEECYAKAIGLFVLWSHWLGFGKCLPDNNACIF